MPRLTGELAFASKASEGIEAIDPLFIMDKQAEQLAELLVVMMVIPIRQKVITVTNSLPISIISVSVVNRP